MLKGHASWDGQECHSGEEDEFDYEEEIILDFVDEVHIYHLRSISCMCVLCRGC